MPYPTNNSGISYYINVNKLATGIAQATIAMYEQGNKELPEEVAETLIAALERRKDL